MSSMLLCHTIDLYHQGWFYQKVLNSAHVLPDGSQHNMCTHPDILLQCMVCRLWVRLLLIIMCVCVYMYICVFMHLHSTLYCPSDYTKLYQLVYRLSYLDAAQSFFNTVYLMPALKKQFNCLNFYKYSKHSLYSCPPF